MQTSDCDCLLIKIYFIVYLCQWYCSSFTSVYPKTDWTYSEHSKDRVELAPGVVAMPNMSRKTIHSVSDLDTLSYSDFLHKETNTESSLTQSNSYASSASAYTGHQPRKLFNNNYEYKYDRYEKSITTSWMRVKRTVVRFFTSILSIFYYTFEVQASWFAKLHNFTSWVMLLDTWLLWKSHSGNKPMKLVALCLVPLLLLGGWWTFTNLGSVLYGIYSNSSLVSSAEEQAIIQDEITFQPPASPGAEVDVEAVIRSKREESAIDQTGIHTPTELSDEQLETLATYLKNSKHMDFNMDTDKLVESIIQSPSFQNIINNYNNIDNSIDNSEVINTQQKMINNLQEEIEKIRLDMSESERLRQEDLLKVLSQIRSENSQANARLTYQLNRCCRRPIIGLETYVTKILKNLLNDAQFLQYQDGFNRFLHGIFTAKQDLESRLLVLTERMEPKYEDLIADNSRIVMNKVAEELKQHMHKEIENARSSIHSSQETTHTSIELTSDEHIKKIVRKVLGVYDADKTGLVDYAMETMGGQILTTRCSENYHYGKAVVSVLGIPLWYPVNSPRTVITPSINPGECWAFQNFPGFVVIQLSNAVEIEAFSMEHISKLLVPNGKIDSAPKEFEVYGLRTENDNNPVKLGQYTYDYNGEPLQFFAVEYAGQVFGIVELRITSNHGNPNYTCLYRFRVHGKLRS